MIIKVSYDINGVQIPDENSFEDSFYLNMDSNNYQPFVGHVQKEDEYDPIYEEGVISPVEEDEGTIVLVTDEVMPSDLNAEIIILSMSDNSKYTIKEDIRYSPVIKNAKQIFVRKEFDKIGYKNIFDNFYKNVNNKCDIYFKINNDENLFIEKWADDLNLKNEILKKDDKKILKVSKNKKNKCLIKLNNDFFNCDIAETMMQKTTGLQDRDILKRNHGMIFPYSNPQNVLFHMGTVKFAIDIIFIDENKKIKKISNNISPNSLGTYGCSETKYVLEIPGGYCKNKDIKVGDRIDIYKFNSQINDIFVDDNPENVLTIPISQALNQDYFLVDKSNNIKYSKDNLYNSNILEKVSSTNRKINSSFNKYIIKDLKNTFFDKVIFTYSGLTSKDSMDILLKNACNSSGIYNLNYDLIRVSKNEDLRSIQKIICNKFSAKNVFLLDKRLEKYGHFTIEKEVKSSANEVIKTYNNCSKKIIEFKKLLTKNKNAYEKIKDNFSAIKKSKGQYKQSIKRLSKKYKAILLDIKKAISKMNEIKDVSKVEEINNTIVVSTRNCSDKVKEVFEMIDQMEAMDFFTKFQKATDDAIKIIEDLSLNIKRMIEFIYSSILGKNNNILKKLHK